MSSVSGNHPSAAQRDVHGLMYQVILRHLAKLRDGAASVLSVFASQSSPEATAGASTVTRAVPAAPPKTPLQARIERHTASVERAFDQIRALNPGAKPRAELPEDVRESIAGRERAIRGIIDAEVHFWAETIEHNPLIRLDETEELWVGRILRLAERVSVSPDNRSYLAFLRDWRANTRH